MPFPIKNPRRGRKNFSSRGKKRVSKLRRDGIRQRYWVKDSVPSNRTNSRRKKARDVIIPEMVDKIDRELYLNTAIERIDNNEINAEETLPNIAEDLVRIFVQGDPISKYLIGKIAKETVWLGIVVIKSSKKEFKVDFIKIKTRKRLDEKIEKIPNDFDKMALAYLDFRNKPKKS